MTFVRMVGIAMILGAIAAAIGSALVWHEPLTARQRPVVLFDKMEFLHGTFISMSLPFFLLGLIFVVAPAPTKIAWAKIPIYFFGTAGLLFAAIEGPYLIAVSMRLSGTWLHNVQEGLNWLMTGAMLVFTLGPYLLRWRKSQLAANPPNAGV